MTVDSTAELTQGGALPPGSLISDDAALAVRAASGDAGAWIQIFETYHPAVYRYVRARVDDAAAEDLAAEVFAAAVAGIGRYSRASPMLAWLYGIARHLVAEHYRRQQRREPFLTRLVRLWHSDADAGERRELSIADPRADVLAHDARVDIGAALTRLTPDQREVITLRYFVGLSTGEIAATLGRQTTAVYSLEARALVRLRAELSVWEGSGATKSARFGRQTGQETRDAR